MKQVTDQAAKFLHRTAVCRARARTRGLSSRPRRQCWHPELVLQTSRCCPFSVERSCPLTATALCVDSTTCYDQGLAKLQPVYIVYDLTCSVLMSMLNAVPTFGRTDKEAVCMRISQGVPTFEKFVVCRLCLSRCQSLGGGSRIGKQVSLFLRTSGHQYGAVLNHRHRTGLRFDVRPRNFASSRSCHSHISVQLQVYLSSSLNPVAKGFKVAS